MRDPDCFLCNPDPKLLVENHGPVFSMVGLGPITNTYAMIVARGHSKSFADFVLENPEAELSINSLRARLELMRGTLLLTEHGRVPVCRDNGDQHDTHCFHAHALLFGTSYAMIDDVRSFYTNESSFGTLGAALEFARYASNYLLISGRPGIYSVLTEQLNAPRQLTRTLVALKCGTPYLADWRRHPQQGEAEAMADSLRAGLESHHD
ncbi:hypothetical protein [Mesorhizobium sp. M0208]|uniref:hypothetical protein n=1 Tax=Mesorhizobium sp. M0208 TaxID=2956916 RepID=UPI00333DAA1D